VAKNLPLALVNLDDRRDVPDALSSVEDGLQCFGFAKDREYFIDTVTRWLTVFVGARYDERSRQSQHFT